MLVVLLAGATGLTTGLAAHQPILHRPAPRPVVGRRPAAEPVASLATTVAPALGAGLANSMFFSGLPEVLEKKRACREEAECSLGEFNPMPMPIILGNTFGWLAYSLLTHDPFVALANAPGLLLASWYVMTMMRMAEEKQALQIEKVAMIMACIHTTAGLACAFFLPTRTAMISLYGIVCNAILLAYYVRTRDFNSPPLPLASSLALSVHAFESHARRVRRCRPSARC